MEPGHALDPFKSAAAVLRCVLGPLSAPRGGWGTSTDRIQPVPGPVTVQDGIIFLFVQMRKRAEFGSGLNLPGAGTQPGLPRMGLPLQEAVVTRMSPGLSWGPCRSERTFISHLAPRP